MRRGSVIVLAGLSACVAPAQRGELVGAYTISGTLTANSCGSDALPAENPLSFSVEVRSENGQGLWVLDMPPSHSGRLDADGTFLFQMQSTYDVPNAAKQNLESQIVIDPTKAADPSAYDDFNAQKMSACRLSITEMIGGKLLHDLRAAGDAGTSAPQAPTGPSGSDLTADNDIGIAPMAGTDCSRVMMSAGGPFLALPCSAHYDLTGSLVAR